jgi:hypothetical protein
MNQKVHSDNIWNEVWIRTDTVCGESICVLQQIGVECNLNPLRNHYYIFPIVVVTIALKLIQYDFL